MINLHGAGDRNRTYDLRVTSALLYRLSYTGVYCGDGSTATKQEATAEAIFNNGQGRRGDLVR